MGCCCLASKFTCIFNGWTINHQYIDLEDKWGLILFAILIVLIGRSLAVYISLAFMKNFPTSWKHVINWGGLKGSLSIALVLSLPRDFEGREDILLAAFSIVLFSLLVQGLSIKPFLALLGVNKKEEGYKEYEVLISKNFRLKASIQELTESKHNAIITGTVLKERMEQLSKEQKELELEMEKFYQKTPSLKEQQHILLEKQSLYAQYEAIEKLLKEEIISDETAKDEQANIIDQLVKLENNH